MVLTLYRRVTEIFTSKLLYGSAWMLIGSIVSGILGFVFQVLMGRMLSIEEYGRFSAMMAVFLILIAPLSTLMMLISRKISNYYIWQDSGSITHFYYWVKNRSAIFGAFILGVYLSFAPQIQFYFKTISIIPVYFLGILQFVSILCIVNNGFLQGLQRFFWLSTSGMLGALLKIIFSSAFVWLGYGLAGALGGIVLAAIIGWLFTFIPLGRPLLLGRGKSFKPEKWSFKFALPVFAANIAFVAMTQLDLVLVNFYFPANEAGLYAAASILSKAALYLSSGIAIVLFPMAAENHARNQSGEYLLIQAVGLTALLTGAGAVLYFLFGSEIIKILYGENYHIDGESLRYLGFAMLPMSLVMVAEYFLIAKGRVLFTYLFVFSAILQVTAIHFLHESLQMIVIINGLSGALLGIIGYGLLWFEFKNKNEKNIKVQS